MSSLSISPEVSTHLLEQWEKVRDFSAQVCHVQAPIGTGSKHVLNHFQRQVADECLTWHIRFRDNLYGWELLPVLANGLWKTIRHSANMVSMVRKSLDLDLGDDRLNAILQSMSESLQFSHDNENAQLRLPADNPILGLVLMARSLMREVPLLIIVENVQLCHSHIPLVFLLAAMQDAQQTRTMVVLHSTVLNDDTVASFPIPAQVLLSTLQGTSVGIVPWTKEEAVVFCQERQIEDPPLDDWMAWSQGRQEMLAEMVVWSQQDPLSEKAIVDRQLVFAPTEFSEFTEQCLRVGALLGWRFSIEQVATMLGVETEKVSTVLQQQPQLIEVEEEGGNASFKYVLHQLRLMEDTIQQLPQISGSVADNLYATFGRTRPELLFQAGRIYSRLQRNAEAQESLRLMADLDADVLYLAMLEVLIRWGIEFDSAVMETLWMRAARHQFTQNPDVALAFQQRALKWSADYNTPILAMDLYRQGGRFLAKKDQLVEAERQFQSAIEVAQQEGLTFLQVDTHIDLVEFYISNTEIRRASKQLILLDGQELSEVQRVRLLGVHARLAQAEGAHQKAAALFVEARTVAGNVYKWGLATDLGLLAAEAMLDAGAMKEGTEMIKILQRECESHDRIDPWTILSQRINRDGSKIEPNSGNPDSNS